MSLVVPGLGRTVTSIPKPVSPTASDSAAAGRRQQGERREALLRAHLERSRSVNRDRRVQVPIAVSRDIKDHEAARRDIAPRRVQVPIAVSRDRQADSSSDPGPSYRPKDRPAGSEASIYF